ncbi:MAG: zf-HC2 domain-containing protein [Thermoanaerobaculia bacterium]
MDCRTASLLIEAYHDDELSLVDAAQLLAHLEGCPPCDQRCEEAAHLRETVRSGRPLDRCPEDLARRLASRVELPNRPRRRSLRPVVVAFACGGGLLVGWMGGRLVPASSSAALAFAPAHRTFEADVFCLRCALRSLLPSGAGETGPHRPFLRTADGKIWIVRPDSAAQAVFRETGPEPRHVLVTATLDERTGLADVSELSDESVRRPASR